MSEARTHTGSCHCGRVTFELDANPTYAMDCNCSLCRRKGALWHGATDATLRILTGQDDLTLYQFGTRTAKHYSCSRCGVSTFTRPRLDPTRWAVNLRCIDDVDLASLPIVAFDGRNWDEAARALRAKST